MKKLNNKILEIEEAIWQGNLIWIINKKYALIWKNQFLTNLKTQQVLFRKIINKKEFKKWEKIMIF